MSVITKVIIDTKEYQHLKEIAAAYKVLVQKKEQSGSGHCCCPRKENSGGVPSISQIAAENDREHAVSPPQKDIIPSITDPYSDEKGNVPSTSTLPSVEEDETLNFSPYQRLEFEEAVSKKERWYYVGPWKENVRQ